MIAIRRFMLDGTDEEERTADLIEDMRVDGWEVHSFRLHDLPDDPAVFPRPLPPTEMVVLFTRRDEDEYDVAVGLREFQSWVKGWNDAVEEAQSMVIHPASGRYVRPEGGGE